MVNAIVLQAFNEVFKLLGFRKKSTNWYRSSGDLYCVVSVQESNWDNSCYVNIGFAPAAELRTGWLPESKCLVRFRAEAITSISRESFDLLSGEVVVERGRDLQEEIVEEIASPVARAVSSVNTVQDLKSLLRTSVGDQVFVHQEIRDELIAEG